MIIIKAHIVSVIFKTFENDKIIEFKLDLDRQIMLSMSVEEGKERMASLYYPEIDNFNYSYFERLLQHYCDADGFSLKKILTHIEKQGFYTPYKPTLRIEVVFK